MSKKLKKSITILTIIILVIIAVVSTFFIMKYFINKKEIDTTTEYYTEDKIQDRLTNDDGNVTKEDLTLKINGETVFGVISIPKINYEGLVYEGTNIETLDKGIGHFENSPFLEGNVCLAGHNYTGVWKYLYTLQNGDKITYTSFLGTKEYEVNKVVQVNATDWTLLEDTDDNILTLVTCVKNEPNLRFIVQAIECK